jgi:hypothetical protein
VNSTKTERFVINSNQWIVIMTKVVINRCYGGFSLSRAAVLRAREISGDPKWGGPTILGDVCENGTHVNYDYGVINEIPRHDPVLVQVVEELGSAASREISKLIIEEVYGPYRIHEYDGMERIETPDDMDWINP